MKKLILFLASIIFCPVVYFPAVAFGQNEADQLTAITAVREGMISAYNKGDIELLLSFVHPDAIVTWQNGETSQGHDQIRAFLNRMLTSPNKVLKNATGNPVVDGRKIFGDHALSWGHMNDRMTFVNGTEMTLDSRFSALLVKDGPKWLLGGIHLSGNLFDNPIQTYALKKATFMAGLGSLIIGLGLGMIIGSCGRKKTIV